MRALHPTAIGAELLDALDSDRGRAILRAALRDEARAAIAAVGDDQLLDVDAAAALLRITADALYRRVSRGTIATVRNGGRVRFRRADLVGGVK